MNQEDQRDPSSNPFHEMYGYHQEGYKVGEEEKRLHFVLKIGFLVMGTFFPLFAFFFYIIWRNDRPKDAKWPGIGCIIGVIVNFGIEIARTIFSLISNGLL